MYFVCILCLLCLTGTIRSDLDARVDREDWVDPFEMGDYDPQPRSPSEMIKTLKDEQKKVKKSDKLMYSK